MGPMQKSELMSLVVKTRRLSKRTYHYCCDIPESKRTPGVSHGVEVKISCDRYIDAGKYIISDDIASERSVKETELIRSGVLNISRKNK